MRAAFDVFDSDNSGNITYKEFRRAMRNYGYEETDVPCESIFMNLKGCPPDSIEYADRVLAVEDLQFLDSWEDWSQMTETAKEAEGNKKAEEAKAKEAAKRRGQVAYSLRLGSAAALAAMNVTESVTALTVSL